MECRPRCNTIGLGRQWQELLNRIKDDPWISEQGDGWGDIEIHACLDTWLTREEAIWLLVWFAERALGRGR